MQTYTDTHTHTEVRALPDPVWWGKPFVPLPFRKSPALLFESLSLLLKTELYSYVSEGLTAFPFSFFFLSPLWFLV